MRVLQCCCNYGQSVIPGVFAAEDDIAAALLDESHPDHERRMGELKQSAYSIHRNRAGREPEITNITDITEAITSCGWHENAAN